MELQNLAKKPADPPTLSIVLPALNEEGNIERAVRHAFAGASKAAATFEVVVVNDGSTDRTAALLKGLQRELGPTLRIVDHGVKMGYGVALRDGFRATHGDLVFYTDSDNQFDLSELEAFIPLMKENDVVFGYRADRQDPWLRKFVSSGFNHLSSLALGISVRDINCSFKLFRGDILRSLPLESSDFFIDTELVALIQRTGCRYVERGVTHYPRTAGRSTVRPSDVPRTLLSIARMWFRLRREARAVKRAAGSPA